MNSFDEKLRQIASSENWEVPRDIDKKINSVLDKLEEKKPLRKRPLKVAIILLTLMATTAVTGFAIKQAISYFSYNKNSNLISSKNEIERLGISTNLSSKDKGIEFTVDGVAADSNFINIFYTIKSDKKIKEIYKDFDKVAKDDLYDKKELYLIPFIDIKANGKRIYESSANGEREAIIVSENELKGVTKVSAAGLDLGKKLNIKIGVDDIYGQKGKWNIETEVDLKKGLKDTYTYNVNKGGVIEKLYVGGKLGEKGVIIKHKINVDKVEISPLGSQIILSETTEGEGNFGPLLSSSFGIFDQDGKSLDLIQDAFAPTSYKEGVNTTAIEILKATKETSSLRLVNYSDDLSKKVKMLNPNGIEKLPMSFKVNDYGSVVVENVNITDKKINIIFYKDGVVPGNTEFFFFDKDGKRIEIGGGFLDYSIDRHTGRYIAKIDLPKNFNDASKIKKISTYELPIKLDYNQEIKVDLVKNNK